MSGVTNNTNIPGTMPVSTPDQQAPASTVNQQDMEDFASQLNEESAGAAEETTSADIRNKLIESMRRHSFERFCERHREMVKEIKKDMDR